MPNIPTYVRTCMYTHAQDNHIMYRIQNVPPCIFERGWNGRKNSLYVLTIDAYSCSSRSTTHDIVSYFNEKYKELHSCGPSPEYLRVCTISYTNRAVCECSWLWDKNSQTDMMWLSCACVHYPYSILLQRIVFCGPSPTYLRIRTISYTNRAVCECT